MQTNEQKFLDLTIIIPTLNEEKNIGTLLKELEKEVTESNIIIADDGSTDDTKKIIESYEGNLNISFLDRRNEKIHGLTISVLDGIKSCKTPYFLVMDGDMQHPPGKIKEFYSALRAGYELVGGEREEIIGEWNFYRKSMSYIASFLGRLILFLRRKNQVKDIMSGFFASKTEIWKELMENNVERFELKGYKLYFDFLRIYPNKLKIKEIPYTFGTRNLGESKISSKVIWYYFRSLFKH